MAKMIEQAISDKEQLLAEIAAADQQHQANEQLIL